MFSNKDLGTRLKKEQIIQMINELIFKKKCLEISRMFGVRKTKLINF